ncbi:hypothetical protein H6G80_30035 [Nostoc sp. FACHB-87]|uniref:hypothetical protein n=1 Tax=Nostocaceae TaxID=1162 RepID=UPI0016839E3F|nr:MULTISPECIES: hypothetical protein [Nostocaceae]MBD2458294.1 hypothetical protein [Nostoc sp. FACHB-87]MBD2479442.1 hypothetical protein [Anabaena sp. FACHB-83]
MPTDIEQQTQKLLQFAQEQNFDERYLGYFGDVWQEAGVKDLSKATTQDAEKALQVLANSAASGEFVKAWLSVAVRQGVPSNVLEYILEIDIDGDGRTLAQEIFVDGTDPLEQDSPAPQQAINVRSQGIELEL